MTGSVFPSGFICFLRFSQIQICFCLIFLSLSCSALYFSILCFYFYFNFSAYYLIFLSFASCSLYICLLCYQTCLLYSSALGFLSRFSLLGCRSGFPSSLLESSLVGSSALTSACPSFFVGSFSRFVFSISGFYAPYFMFISPCPLSTITGSTACVSGGYVLMGTGLTGVGLIPVGC